MKNQLTQDLFRAYYDARRNKRSKKDVIEFEMNYEQNLFALADDIWSGKYQPGVSSCFIVKKPVKREIFAASFRDRIVHHLIYDYINPIFERSFINDSYSCRIAKGTSYGIKRLNHFIRSCSENYQKDCYVLKLDISGYFMSINKEILFKKITSVISCHSEQSEESRSATNCSLNTLACYPRDPSLRSAPFRMTVVDVVERESTFSVRGTRHFDYRLINDLIEKTIFYNPIKNCAVKGKREDWAGLPKSKSLFFTQHDCGLPIGNLTSQLFGNIYLNEFDHFVKKFLKIKYYGRYVDDMVFVHCDREYLKSIISQIRIYLKNNLGLKLHEKKIYLQHHSRGVDFLGTILKPYRIYIKNRSKGNFYDKICYWNKFLKEGGNKISEDDIKKFLSSVNSYIGLMKHFDTVKLRRKMINELSIYFWNYVCVEKGVLRRR